jgi:hypothetical protein
MDTLEQMQLATDAVKLLVAELQAADIGHTVVASVLMAAAGSLWRDALPDAADRRLVVTHAAEVAITGLAQPFPETQR